MLSCAQLFNGPLNIRASFGEEMWSSRCEYFPSRQNIRRVSSEGKLGHNTLDYVVAYIKGA